MRKKTGFYIVSLLVIGLITTSIMISKEKPEDSNKSKVNPEDDFVILNEEEPYIEISRMEEELSIDNYRRNRDIQQAFEENLEDESEDETEDEAEGETEEDLEEEPSDLNYTLVDGISSMELENMLKPVDGGLGLSYTSGNLIYSKTLEEWTNHNGIDILASEGTPVKAVLSGTIAEVYKDQLWGIVIIIDHGDGLLTKYVNLSEETNVMEGWQVDQGDTIGTIGQTATIEMMEEPHLHFEVIENGVNKNPLDYLPKFSTNK